MTGRVKNLQKNPCGWERRQTENEAKIKPLAHHQRYALLALSIRDCVLVSPDKEVIEGKSHKHDDLAHGGCDLPRNTVIFRSQTAGRPGRSGDSEEAGEAQIQ